MSIKRAKTATNKPKLHLKLILKKDPELNYKRILSKTAHIRSTVSLKENRDTLTIEIKANDITALRASANSILRDIQVIEATKL